ncbi:10230_t:CDS:2, partial [Dentiscutata erythropus]
TPKPEGVKLGLKNSETRRSEVGFEELRNPKEWSWESNIEEIEENIEETENEAIDDENN